MGDEQAARTTIRWWPTDDGRWEAELPDGSRLRTLTEHGLLSMVARRCADRGIAYRFDPAPALPQ
jgi:hypothetical protein